MKGWKTTGFVLALAAAFAGSGWAVGSDGDFERWKSAVAAQGIDPAEVVYPFAATPEMQSWAREKMKGAGAAGPLKRLKILQSALFDREHFDFEYDSILTLSGQQAFAQRRGNCMAFTALFISLGRSLGIPTVLVSVQRVPGVDRVGGLVIINRHVVAGYRGSNSLNLFDFYVTSSAPPVHQRIISDLQASAMHHTNLGGTALRAGDLLEARRQFELATGLAPEWGPGWVNLGVVEFREGRAAKALKAYAKALEVEPSNSSALTNIAAVHRDQGHDDAARSALAAAARQTRNPFTLIAIADIEMYNGNLGKARSYLRRARWWFSSEPEVYAAMARLARCEGDDQAARRYLMRAQRMRKTE